MKDKWIPVTVRVPDTRRPVLAWGKACILNRKWQETFIGEARFNNTSNGGKWDKDQSTLYSSQYVTHWQEIEGPDEANSIR